MLAVRRQLVLEMEEFAFQLAERRRRLGRRIDQHMPFPAIDDHRVSRLDMTEHTFNAAHGGNPATASDNRRMACLAAALRDNAAHVDVAQRHRLRR